jgi:hypothetical protein
MQHKKPKGYYLFGALLAFVLSAYGFAGMLAGKRGYLSPGSAGFLCFVIGTVFVYFYFKER